MSSKPDPLSADQHKQAGIYLFNRVWALLEKADRSQAEDEEMLNAAHASRYHWSLVGDETNIVRGEWQISRVYSVLGRGEPALHHGLRSLELCLHNNIGDFDLAFAYEAVARGHMTARSPLKAENFTQEAVAAGEAIADPEDRKSFENELTGLPGFPEEGSE